ncbi:MAG: HAMP domain-containing sensor histidine kinase [Thomasclavelia sp.]|nr:HAMP domain-containing sensor histidine kinase [Thomasclavelia sp.]
MSIKKKRFSLLAQLALIFLVLFIAVIFVVTPIVNKNLNSIVADESYSTLEDAQKNYINYGNYSKAKSDKFIYHYEYNLQDNYITSVMTDMPNRLSQEFYSAYQYDLAKCVNYDKKYIESTGEVSDQTIFYRITKEDDNTYLISVMYSDYSDKLATTVNQQIISVLYGLLAGVGLVMFIFILFTISPLKKIENYIKAIKEGKDATLKINRHDEIGSLATSLVDMKEELDNQSKIKEEMIHNISHDLKTPIALIKTYTQSVKDGVYPYGDKDASLDVILDNADRLNDKVRTLLYLNRLDYLSDEDCDSQTNMFDLISDIKEQFTVMHPEINIDFKGDEINFKGVDEHWRICLENILENAYRYVKEEIIIILKDGYLEIHNDGEPIDEALTKQLFEPYRKGSKGEFGLGLSIVHKTVTMYGYNIEAINKDNGVSFIIRKR